VEELGQDRLPQLSRQDQGCRLLSGSVEKKKPVSGLHQHSPQATVAGQHFPFNSAHHLKLFKTPDLERCAILQYEDRTVGGAP
jgi:hypothetical protein